MPQSTRPMAKKPNHAPIPVLIIREIDKPIRTPQPLIVQTINAAVIIPRTINAPGIMPATNRSEIGRFSRKP